MGKSDKELEAGVKVEKEHADTLKKVINDAAESKEKAKNSLEKYEEMIAKDHIDEFSNYYTGPGGLLDMEKNLKASAGNTGKFKIFLTDLHLRYRNAGLDLTKAIRVWGEQQLSPQDIKDIVFEDIHLNIAPSECAFLSDLSKRASLTNQLLPEYLIQDAYVESERLNRRSKVVLTPKIKHLVERVGSTNYYRSKIGGVVWKVILDNNIPHLARIDEEIKDGEHDKEQ